MRETRAFWTCHVSCAFIGDKSSKISSRGVYHHHIPSTVRSSPVDWVLCTNASRWCPFMGRGSIPRSQTVRSSEIRCSSIRFDSIATAARTTTGGWAARYKRTETVCLVGWNVLRRTRTVWGTLGGRRFVPTHSESTTAVHAVVWNTDRGFTTKDHSKRQPNELPRSVLYWTMGTELYSSLLPLGGVKTTTTDQAARTYLVRADSEWRRCVPHSRSFQTRTVLYNAVFLTLQSIWERRGYLVVSPGIFPRHLCCHPRMSSPMTASI